MSTFKNKLTRIQFYSALILIYMIVPVKFIQAICIAVLLIFLFSFVYSKIIERNLVIERSITDIKLAQQEQVKITISVKNKSRLPIFICHVFDDVKTLYVFKNQNAQLLYLRPREIKQISYVLLASSRGVYEIGPVKIKSNDPLNLFPIEMNYNSMARITVRPERITLSTKPLPSLPQGLIDINNPCYEDITMRRSIREYRNGDEIKRINWRAFAKFGKIFTNEYEDTFDSPFFVFLNLAEEDYKFDTRREKTELAICLAANIIEKAAELHQRVGFACYGTDFPFIHPKQNQYDVILDLLATIQMEHGKLSYDPEKKYKPQLPNGTLFFNIGPKQVDDYDYEIKNGRKDTSTNQLGIIKKV